MGTTVSSNYTGVGSGGTIPGGNNGLVPRGVSVISSGATGLNGDGSHTVHVFGDVFGESVGISLGTYTQNLIDRLFVYTGASVSANDTAVEMTGSINTIVNYGDILSASAAVDGFNTNDGAKLTIRNYGNISGVDYAISTRGSVALDLQNFGTVDATGLFAINCATGVGNKIYNHGSINGLIFLSAGSDSVINRGLINGDVNLSDGINFLDNRGGTIEGTITFGTGDDTFRPGAGIETAIGGDGTDTLDFSVSGAVLIALDESVLATGAAKDDTYTGFENIIGSKSGSDVLIGDSQANVLSGLSGADKLSGQAGADTLNGGLGNDTLDGGADNDELNGGMGDDKLLGGLGSDTLAGNDGNDLLTGGAGDDMLAGGLGSDRFVFLAKDFVGIDQNAPDEILDFTQAEHDVIDLSAVDASSKVVGNQAFIFIGMNSFHSIAGELRYQQVAGNTYVFGDINGDGIADFTLLLDGLLTMAARDFIL